MDWSQLVLSERWVEALMSELVHERLEHIARQMRTRHVAESPFDHGRLVGQEEMWEWLLKTFPKRLENGGRHNARPLDDSARPVM